MPDFNKKKPINKRRQEKKEFVVTIGVLLKEVLEKQKKKVSEVTYDCVKASDYEAGEILATKIKEKNLV